LGVFAWVSGDANLFRFLIQSPELHEELELSATGWFEQDVAKIKNMKKLKMRDMDSPFKKLSHK